MPFDLETNRGLLAARQELQRARQQTVPTPVSTARAYDAWVARMEKRFSGHSYIHIIVGTRERAGLCQDAFVALTDEQRDAHVADYLSQFGGGR